MDIDRIYKWTIGRSWGSVESSEQPGVIDRFYKKGHNSLTKGSRVNKGANNLVGFFTKTIVAYYLVVLLFPATLLAVQLDDLEVSSEVKTVVAIPNAHSSVLKIQPEKLWHVGADDDEEFGPMGHIVDTVSGREGFLYLLDETLVVVRKFDSQGRFIQNIGCQGEGPGEFNNPVRLNIFPDNNLGVFQLFPSCIVLLDNKGMPHGMFNSQETNYLRHRYFQARSSNDFSVLSESESTISGNVMTSLFSLKIYDAHGNYLDTAIDQKKESPSRGMTVDDGMEFNGLATCWDISNANSIFLAPYFDQYKVLVFDLENSKQTIIQVEYNPVRRSDEQLAELEKGKKLLQKVEGRTVDIYQYQRDISGLYCRPNNNLWVLSSQGVQDCPENQLGIFHVYDSDGLYLYNLSLLVDYNPRRDSFRIDKDFLFILKESKMKPATTHSAQYGNSMVMSVSRGPESELLAEATAKPFSVICYKLPQ